MTKYKAITNPTKNIGEYVASIINTTKTIKNKMKATMLNINVFKFAHIILSS